MKQLLILFLLFLFLINPALALANNTVNIYLFWAQGCPHCSSEKIFLNQLMEEYDNLVIHEYEVTNNADNVRLLQQAGERLGITVNGVPFTVIGEHYIIGWYDEKTTGNEIREAISCASNNLCVDIISGLTQATNLESDDTLINLPIFGFINPKSISIPLISVVLGLIDGFNPCAMWVLLFLISLLLGVKNEFKRWVYGSVFIISSTLVYFLFMTTWLNLFLFIGFVFWIRIVIGLIAFYAGYVNIKEFITNPSGCPVTGDKERQKIFTKLKKFVQEKHFLLGLLGLFALAFIVNLVELVCSAGLPAIFTQILAINDLSTWQYYFYILLYLLFFMLDDLIVFTLAMFTMKETGLSTKYGHWTRLIGGILMFIIGALIILKPEWLMFT